MRELLGDADARGRAGLQCAAARRPPGGGYWPILAERYAEDRGGRRARGARSFGLRAAAPGDAAAYRARAADATGALEGFTGAPLTGDEAARRAQQLLRFLALVPVEYGRGVKGRRVTLDFEVQEAIAFRTGAAAAFADLQRPARQARRGRTARPAPTSSA
jgi:high-affinity iron transporter